MKLGMQVRLGPGHIVLDGGPAPHPPKGHSPRPIFGPYLVRPNGCIAWIKMPLGMELSLSPGDFVLDGDPALPSLQKGTEPPSPIFGPFLLWPNGCMHQDATWYGGRRQPRGITRGPSPLNFRPMFIIVIVISL